ncbi:MAG: hypothetical protein WA139_04065 [Candidatus Aenigmatarchaeota archaeon]
MNERRKGMALATMFAFIIFMSIALIFGIVVVALHYLNISAVKELVVNVIYEPVSTQDALLSLTELRGGTIIGSGAVTNDITFSKALVYAVYENTMKPEFYFSGKKYRFDIQQPAKNYLDYVYAKRSYKLFLYNPETKEEKIIAREGSDDDFKLYPYGKRDSIPIKPENFWLVLYVK